MSGARGALYAAELQAAETVLETAVAESFPSPPGEPAADRLRGARDALARQLDRTVLPVVCHELALAREAGALSGRTPAERYEDFWARERLTPGLLADRYPVVAAGLSVIASTGAATIAYAVRRLAADLPELVAAGIEPSDPRPAGPYGPRSVTPVGSDRHAGGGQVVACVLRSGRRVYYKPVPLAATILLHDFADLLDLPDELRLRRPAVVTRGTYGWQEEARFAPCASAAEVRRYWARCGVLLAVCCLLNFTDGHFENLVACGEHPVLVDTETLLQNYSWRNPSGRLESVVDTGLVQHADPDAPGRGAFSAFQVLGGARQYSLDPVPADDGTDTMTVGFSRLGHEPPVNLPVLEGRFQPAAGHLPELLTGFRAVFARCRERRAAILADGAFWDRVAAQESRQIIRETAYYTRLLRLAEQPAYATSRDGVAAELARRLETPEGSRYDALVADEVSALLAHDVPYFRHPVSGTTLRAHTRTHPAFFRTSALSQVRANIADLGEEFAAAQAAFLTEHLSTPPDDVSLSPDDVRLLGDRLTPTPTGLA
ncbi:DUF4135 domain-containing protein [Actinoallomurus iriomotensis]|uniref:Lantibiotic biosynthesis protein dehydration domain-containing protein n=1 Tax=Actinoallomurus iriomotensis TaxID=478107 RepID=A0A9W6S6W6_9ACTN|nr:DUF4135 domain-containing protein [Actinoallomurus iriomotensis]GLY88218.1 hypothetical protein Airi02_061470 [Actinoallomurus iriomotensis]